MFLLFWKLADKQIRLSAEKKAAKILRLLSCTDQKRGCCKKQRVAKYGTRIRWMNKEESKRMQLIYDMIHKKKYRVLKNKVYDREEWNEWFWK